MVIWGEEDQIFPLELGYRLKRYIHHLGFTIFYKWNNDLCIFLKWWWSRHIGENAEIVVIKKAGHAVNLEKSKEFLKHLKSFLIDCVWTTVLFILFHRLITSFLNYFSLLHLEKMIFHYYWKYQHHMRESQTRLFCLQHTLMICHKRFNPQQRVAETTS